MTATMTKILAHIAILSASAFNNPGWKLDAEGKPELKDGNPIYVDASGRESVMDVGAISALNREAQKHREAKEAAETKLRAFEGIDPELARKALDTVKNIDAKKLIDAGEVDKVRESVKAEFMTQLAEKDKALGSLQGEIDGMKIGGVFTGSEFLRERVALPLDMMQAYFGSNFKLENGKVTAYYKDGNPVMSKQQGNVGNPASAEEALQLLIDTHPQKDLMLKADGGSGSGSNGNGGNRGGGRTMKRADFEKLGPAAAAEAAGKMRSGELQITD